MASVPTLAVALVGLVSFVLTASLAVFVRMPVPSGPDEFSNLLAADTFVHGRPTNPPHPLWQHFETLHVIQQPTYASKYPPAQGLVLAAGQVFAGAPIVGVWLSTALASAAICWMLFAWVPPRWALLGGILAALHPLVLGRSQDFTGGAVAMIGGALVVGALRRMIPQPRVQDALIMGIGILLLANSRPFEGMVLCLVCVPVLLAGIWRAAGDARLASLGTAVLPLGAVLALGAVAMGWYNVRVTSDPFRMPYMVHQAAYDVAPSFLWQPLMPGKKYRHADLRYVHAESEVLPYLEQQSVGGFLRGAVAKLGFLGSIYLSTAAFLLSLLALPWLLARPGWTRFALIGCGIFLAALLSETWLQAHYAAPATGLIFVVLMLGLRGLHAWRWHGRPLGRLLVRAAVALSLLSVVRLGVDLHQYQSVDRGRERVAIVETLAQAGGRHLIVVHCSRPNELHEEWVYNSADVDASAVVWARPIDEEHEQILLDYYKNRQAWRLEIDAPELRLAPYPEPRYRTTSSGDSLTEANREYYP